MMVSHYVAYTSLFLGFTWLRGRGLNKGRRKMRYNKIWRGHMMFGLTQAAQSLEEP